ncbi:MAG: deaminase [Candidatus Dadabacteria bacterium]|nr:MAG: deaminase [Candidatus Dadabacteria bacterium]
MTDKNESLIDKNPPHPFPKPLGHYSHFVSKGGIWFIAGQIGINPKTGALEEGFKPQAKRIMDNIELILNENNVGLNSILKTTVYLTDISTLSEFNDIYAEKLGSVCPARSAVEVKSLPNGALVEVEMCGFMCQGA